MSNWKVSAPSPGGGFSKEEHVGHLLLFVDPRGEETAKFSGEGTQTAARCTHLACVTCGLVLTDLLLYGDALAPRIVDAGEIVAGRLTVGKARAGRSAPYLLDEADAGDLGQIEAFLDAYAVRMPSGKVIIETPDAHAEEVF